MTHCSICGRELTDPISVARGVGPECIINVKNDSVGQGALFANRARYDYRIRDGVLMLIDLGTGKSLTNDMELALKEINETEGDITQYKIMYKDSYGEWTGVIYEGKRVRFFGIGETDQNTALKVLDKRWKLASTTRS